MDKKTLVFGASLNPNRYSNMAIKRLVNNGLEVVAYGLKEGEISGINIDTNLKDYENIDTVTVYMISKKQKDFIMALFDRNFDHKYLSNCNSV